MLSNLSMSEPKWRAVTSEELARDLEEILPQRRENKYAAQVGLADITITIDETKAEPLGLSLPFQSVVQGECALRERIITPTTFLENDGTEHHVIAFDPKPIGFSGFMSCVTHSLALTDQGLFDVGRYSAISTTKQDEYWQWFLHQRLATPGQVAALREERNLSPHQLVERLSTAMAET